MAIPDPIFSCGDLGAILKSGLELSPHSVTIFLGMDCPYLSAADYQQAVAEARAGRAYISPAEDGGYVLLALPPRTPPGRNGPVRRHSSIKVLRVASVWGLEVNVLRSMRVCWV